MKTMANALIHIWEYGFFDDNYTLAAKGYHGEDKLSLYQFLFMGGMFALIVVLSCFLRKADRRKLTIMYRVLAVFMIVAEAAKIFYSTYFDLLHGEPFNAGGILPFYTCSMALYLLPVLGWAKGKPRQWAAAWFSTIGLVAGLSNFVYLSAASVYPILSYGGLYSVFFHVFIVFVGMSLMITGEYKVTWHSIVEAMIPTFIFGALVIPINFLIYHVGGQGYVDYMLLMDVNGFLSPVATWFKERNIHFLFSFLILFVGYPIATAIITAIDIAIAKACENVHLLSGKHAH